jgi:hypothetical protein
MTPQSGNRITHNIKRKLAEAFDASGAPQGPEKDES